MPLDPMFTGPMLDPFRTMMKEIDDKGLTGTDVDEMRAHLQVMEDLAQSMSDIAAYSGRLVQDMVFQKFGDAYGRVLSSAAQTGDVTDEQMLADLLGVYEQTLETYRSGQGGEEIKLLIPYVERVDRESLSLSYCEKWKKRDSTRSWKVLRRRHGLHCSEV